jgi:hypothetical protein
MTLQLLMLAAFLLVRNLGEFIYQGQLSGQLLLATQTGHSILIQPKSFENSVELCDASIEFVESSLDQLGESALPSFFWCAWR